jgi:hypothetical protein
LDYERDRPTANRAIFDKGLVALRSIDLERENFAAMGTGDLGLDQ